ncbi:glutamate/aspartate transport system substrate-binding protein [Pelomonas saccharophila]|uniref:Glutamate/aspartate transport system substrate-binding protein n=1 Tax=Roseateles saccharophilus TaxID=304 RepID=A0ABU1YW92_ROSSA|nr:transporter substrate-binding domain-containing protein [Roseateles saccharophilus]MDR7272481.1 glutamate/aspartate transport system substrate-binding protein [Roseateles saccharophilus]
MRTVLYCWALLGLLELAQAAPSIHVPAQEKAPHKFILDGPQPSGICPDLLRALERLDPGLRFHGYGSALSLPLIDVGLRNGNVGAACGLLERAERHAYATRLLPPLYRVRHRVAVRADDEANPRSLADLLVLSGDQAVIVTRGSAYPAMLREAGFKVDDSTGDYQANLRKLLAGRARFIYGGEQALWRSIQQAQLTQRLRLLPTVFAEEPIYLWASQQLSPAQREGIARGLERLEASGELAAIVRHYHQQP